MSSEITIDPMTWINEYLGGTVGLNRYQIDSVLMFALLWNLFEGRLCNYHANYSTFERLVERLQKEGRLDHAEFEELLRHFASRYVEGNTLTSQFSRLHWRSGDDKALVADVLMRRRTDINDVALALILIVYRLRNNLFHGIKELMMLGEQTDNFRHANRLLIHLLELDK